MGKLSMQRVFACGCSYHWYPDVNPVDLDAFICDYHLHHVVCRHHVYQFDGHLIHKLHQEGTLKDKDLIEGMELKHTEL